LSTVAAQHAAAASQQAGWNGPTAYGPTDRPLA